MKKSELRQIIREEIQRLSEGNTRDLEAAHNNIDKWLDLRDLQKVLKISNKNTQLKKMMSLIDDSDLETLSDYMPNLRRQEELAKHIIKQEG